MISPAAKAPSRCESSGKGSGSWRGAMATSGRESFLAFATMRLVVCEPMLGLNTKPRQTIISMMAGGALPNTGSPFDRGKLGAVNFQLGVDKSH